MDHEDHGPKMDKQNKKHDTAADQFSKYQDEYEARGRPSSDKMQQVLNHNQTYPKLQRELDKRRSTGEISNVKKSRLASGSRRNRQKTPQRARRPKKITRVIKKRPKKPCRCSKCLALKLRENSKLSQFTNYVMVINRRIGTEPCETDHHPESGAPVPPAHRDDNNRAMEIISPPPSKAPSDISFTDSLHLDHEPMV